MIDLDSMITTSPGDAAKEILKNSFAIYRVSDRTVELIRAARLQAINILDGPASSSSSSSSSFQRIIQGQLHGYNEPSKSKRLFRAFCAASQEQQPWPNIDFQRSSINVAEALHDLLVACAKKIEREVHEGRDDDQRPRKRRRVSSNSLLNGDHKSHRMMDYPNCPLDYFFYHNNNPDPESENCSEHIDRGALICVCLSAVPGLEVRLKSSDTWFCPESLIHNANLYQEKEPVSALICIMAGDQLTEFVGQKIACVHRVRKNLKRARLSISYELRL